MTKNSCARWALAARWLVIAAAAVGVLGLIAGQVSSQDQSPPKGGDQAAVKPGEPAGKGEMSEAEKAEMMEMMKLWQQLGTPGEHHKHLEHFVGSWDIVIKSWCGGPDSPATESKGTARTRWILDGRYLVEEVKSEMVMPDPVSGKEKKMPFEGQGITGYDNYKNLYVSLWMDNMSTQILSTKGSIDEKGKTLMMYGDMDEPMLGVHGRTIKCVTRILDMNKHVFEMHDLHAGDNYKVMEITYTRKK